MEVSLWVGEEEGIPGGRPGLSKGVEDWAEKWGASVRRGGEAKGPC